MYAYNVFFEKFLMFWFFCECLQILRRVHFFSEHSICGQQFLPPAQYAGNNFTAFSVCGQKSLPPTQYAGNNFYQLLSMQTIIFTAYSVIA
jgi:hypothetical protein